MTKIAQIIELLQCFLQKKETILKYRLNDIDFIRASKLGFMNTVMLGLYRFKASLDAELYNLLKKNNLAVVSKSAYSQSRYKINSDIYVDLNDILIDNLKSSVNISNLSTNLPAKTFGGFGVHAVDGSKITLPNTQELQAHFGSQQGGSKETPTQTAMCLLMCCYDVLNNLFVKSQIEPLTIGEQTVVKQWVQAFDSQSITLFDRGFPSIFFCHCMLKYNKPFVMRARVNFNKVVSAFYASDEVDSIVSFVAESTIYNKYL